MLVKPTSSLAMAIDVTLDSALNISTKQTILFFSSLTHTHTLTLTQGSVWRILRTVQVQGFPAATQSVLNLGAGDKAMAPNSWADFLTKSSLGEYLA